MLLDWTYDADAAHMATALPPSTHAAWKAAATAVPLASSVLLTWACQAPTQSLQTLQGVFSQVPNISQPTAPVLLAQLQTLVNVAMLQKKPLPEQSPCTLQLVGGLVPDATGSKVPPATPVMLQ
jgi:hypothetical protein